MYDGDGLALSATPASDTIVMLALYISVVWVNRMTRYPVPIRPCVLGRIMGEPDVVSIVKSPAAWLTS